MIHLIEEVGELAARDAGSRLLTEQIDTTTSEGMLVLDISGSLAQFERAPIRERINLRIVGCKENGEPWLSTSDHHA